MPVWLVRGLAAYQARYPNRVFRLTYYGSGIFETETKYTWAHRFRWVSDATLRVLAEREDLQNHVLDMSIIRLRNLSHG